MPLPSLHILDTLTQTKVNLSSLHTKKLRVYCCGPTVYGYTHIGNARAALTLDLISRLLEKAGFEVESARNVTDIDDKIIQVAKKEKQTTHEIAEFYERAYNEDMRALKVKEPTHTPHATESLSEILSFIQELLQKGLAYELRTETGLDIYFRVASFPHYGALSRQKIDEMQTGTRVERIDGKESEADFALWKSTKADEPSWESPWGPGRPGWHIECSAMIQKIFDGQVDIHLGGIDLIFPHHENEIAQSEGRNNKPLARVWAHNGMLELGHEKMSKSLGNIVRTRDFLKDYGAETLRILVFQQHYRSPMDISEESFLRSEALIERLYACKKLVSATEEITSTETLPIELLELVTRAEESLYDDFNSAKALGLILGCARICFRAQRPTYWKAWGKILPILEEVFGILEKDPQQALQENRQRRLARMNVSEERSREIDQKIKERELMRLKKDFLAADVIRTQLEAEGVMIMDGPDGTSWSQRR